MPGSNTTSAKHRCPRTRPTLTWPASQIIIPAALMALLIMPGPLLADSREDPGKHAGIISFCRDFESSTDMSTLFTVPEGHYLVVTDVVAYWWGEGPAQKVQFYDKSDLKASFLVFGRNADANRQGSKSSQVFSSQQSGLVWGPGSPLRVLPSTTQISVTISGFLLKSPEN